MSEMQAVAQRDSSARRLNQRPQMLFLCQTLPFPPDGGVHLRSYNILRLLSRSFDITALCFYRQMTRPSPAHVTAGIDGLSRFAEVEAFPIPQEHSRARLVWDHLRSLIARRVYTRFAYESTEYADRLRSLLKAKRFDVVHMDSLDLSAYLPLLTDLPVLCTHHNVESQLLRRAAVAQESPLLRLYTRLQARLAEKEEKIWCPRVTANVVVSAQDLAQLKRIVSGGKFFVVPSGVDTTVFFPTSQQTSGIVFVGGHGWFPNRDGMRYFCDEILPKIRAGSRDVRVTWVGQAPANVRSEYADRYNVDLTDFVDDIRPFVQGAACYIVPLRVGGGTRLKILDAWAMGKAVVSTSIGCEGLAAVDDNNILVRDDPQEFATAVLSVLEDAKLRHRLGTAARSTAEDVYEWDVISGNMIEQYLRLLAVR